MKIIAKDVAVKKKAVNGAELQKGRNPSGISAIQTTGIKTETSLAKLRDEVSKKRKRNGSAKEANDSHRGELEIMAGRKITDLENYYRNG